MKKEFNFKNIKGMLSRDEMKAIKGGSGGQCVRCTSGSMSSCWYTTRGAGVCVSVYPPVAGSGPWGVSYLGSNCSGCIMN